MRLIGGHDYYDGAGWGVDTSIVFTRKPHFIENDPFTSLSLTARNDSAVYLFDVCIGGETYPGAYFYHRNFSTPSIYKYCYDFDELVEITKEYFNWQESYWESGGSWTTNLERARRHFAKDIRAHEQWLLDNRVVVGHSRAEIVPSLDNHRERVTVSMYTKNSKFLADHSGLKDIEFYKCVNAQEAHMKCARWVGGVLPFSKETIEITDKSKIVKAGFDLKTSFRKMKNVAAKN